MPKRVRMLSKFLLILWLHSFVSSVSTAQSLMTVRVDEHHDVSPPMRDLIAAVPSGPFVLHEAEPVRRIPLPPSLTSLPEDPIRQRTVAMGVFAPTISLTFEGLGQGQYGFIVSGAPPDTNGAAGQRSTCSG
jgi:hypothetical protein